jgi:hypothetical protein
MPRLKLPLAVLVFGAAAYFYASGTWPWHRLSFDAAPKLAMVAPVLAPAATESLDTLHQGETVSALFARHGVDGIDLPTLSRKLAFDPRRLRAGLVFSFRHAAPDSEPETITVRTSPEQRLLFTRAASGWDAQAEAIQWRPEIVRVEGNIDNSLYEALDDQVPDSILAGSERTGLAWALADVYDWQVDFTRDIQPGDHFQVVLERLVSAEGDVRFGRILASDLSVGGRPAHRLPLRPRLHVLRRQGKFAEAGLPPRAARVPPHLLHVHQRPVPPRPRHHPEARRHRLRRGAGHAGACGG